MCISRDPSVIYVCEMSILNLDAICSVTNIVKGYVYPSVPLYWTDKSGHIKIGFNITESYRWHDQYLWNSVVIQEIFSVVDMPVIDAIYI